MRTLLLFISLQIPFCSFSQLPVDTVNTDISAETFWYKDSVHLLVGPIFVKNNAQLLIEPGTIIKGDKTSKGMLVITRGARIFADGTPDEPIVFTSNEATPNYGDWGGIILLGKAPTNLPTYPEPCCFCNSPTDSLLFYGGQDPEDNSGVLRFVRIEYPGIALQPNNEINGLTMAGVGRGTLIDYVQVAYCADDAFEWFGGTVNCKHLASTFTVDDDFDCDDGYQGNVQFAFALRDPQAADISGSNGFEIDNNPNGSDATPKTSPAFSNVTLIGPLAPVDPLFRRAAHIRRRSEPCIVNSLILGNWPYGFFLEGDSVEAYAADGRIELNNNYVAGAVIPIPGAGIFDWPTWFSANGNTISSNPNAPLLVDPYGTSGPVNPLLLPNSAALNSADFGANCINGNPFFEPVPYAGAFDTVADSWASGNWMQFLYLTAPPDSSTAVSILPDESFTVRLSPSSVGSQSTLQLQLSYPCPVKIEIWDITGQKRGDRILFDATAGEHVVPLDVSLLHQGLYLVRIQAGQAVKTEKLIVVR